MEKEEKIAAEQSRGCGGGGGGGGEGGGVQGVVQAIFYEVHCCASARVYLSFD